MNVSTTNRQPLRPAALTDAALETRVADAWAAEVSACPEEARCLAQDLAGRHAVALVGHFYIAMLKDESAGGFLSHELVERRLAASLQQWLAEVLAGGDDRTIAELIERQLQVGQVHARIGIPAHLVAAGARMIKQKLAGHIEASGADCVTVTKALRYASTVIDLAVEAMIAAYAGAHEESVKDEEAYRYFVGIHHIGLERERQQGCLLEWENLVVFQLATGAPLENLPLLSGSPFGLWYKHKGEPVFNKDPQAGAVAGLIADCDTAVCSLRDEAGCDTPQARTDLMRRLHDYVARIKALTLSMFEKIMELESGRDELTHLLNRRFLPTVLRREVALSSRGRKPFAVIMLDVDHFKAVNDRYGHSVGDLALQAVAAVLVRNLRVSDYAFRYGGEEFLIVVVEVDSVGALSTAERIRQQIARESIVLPEGGSLSLTVSVGVAIHTGHPDYARLIEAADTALYRAKSLGRNRVEMADSDTIR